MALHNSAAQGIILCTRELLAQPAGDASECGIRAAACERLVSAGRAWDLGMNASPMAVYNTYSDITLKYPARA